MKKKYWFLTICSLLALVTALFLTINFNSDIVNNLNEDINDYTSDLYQEIAPDDLNLTEKELLKKLKVPIDKREEYEFKFYKLEYKDLIELHAIGKTDGEKCFNVAMTNAGKFFSNYKQASVIKFFQSELPSEYHSCEGDPCESCEFERDDDDEITGCDCSYLGGHCNHTIISG